MSERPFYKKFQTFNISGLFSEENFKSALNYKASDDDLFIVSYPKCGSTWTQHIIYLILHNGVPLPKDGKMGECVPFLETVGSEAVEKIPSPRVIKTHLSYDFIPKNPNAKYIFIIRNPKDCLVSFYYHTRGFIDAYKYADGKFDDYFELFINGEVDYGDYFDHLLSWYPHVSDKNVLFLTYESMKQDPKANIVLIANFMGKKYADLLLTDDILENVIKYSNVSEMKKNDDRWYRTRRVENTQFVRKGVIGDWRNHFSDDQSKRFDEKINQRLENIIDIGSLWSDDMLK
jgi:hypothetical protein